MVINNHPWEWSSVHLIERHYISHALTSMIHILDTQGSKGLHEQGIQSLPKLPTGCFYHTGHGWNPLQNGSLMMTLRPVLRWNLLILWGSEWLMVNGQSWSIMVSIGQYRLMMVVALFSLWWIMHHNGWCAGQQCLIMVNDGWYTGQ